MTNILSQRRLALVPGQEAHLILERYYSSYRSAFEGILPRIGLTQNFVHRKSRDLPSSSRWKFTPSNEERQDKFSTWDSRGDGEVSTDRTTHKRKHDTYTQDDQRRYSEILTNIPHLSDVDPDIGVKLLGKEAFGVRCTKIVFKKVRYCSGRQVNVQA